ncbi:hypothetical protein B9Z55_014051 [Caenorhabditis nigoni]|uniref:Uncharacterized protein n=1 Tax=Caenorhabditis nigoni TaxID=1611254 RepID=A0A2G5U4V9_9PELO|nr:hypothetical protein B9Z55_014051 [Caenorhabditis nigoni]
MISFQSVYLYYSQKFMSSSSSSSSHQQHPHPPRISRKAESSRSVGGKHTSIVILFFAFPSSPSLLRSMVMKETEKTKRVVSPSPGRPSSHLLLCDG